MTHRPRLRSWLTAAAVLATSTAGIAAGTTGAHAAHPTGHVTGHATGHVSAAPGQALVAGRTVNVSIDAGHHVHMLGTMRPGVHRFVARSEQGAEFQVVQLTPGYTPAQVVADVNAGLAQNGQPDLTALKRFEAHVTLLGGVPSHSGRDGEMWLRLQRGSYWAVDVDASPVTVDELKPFTVSGPSIGGNLRADATIRAVHSVDWAKRPRSIPRQGTLKLKNLSSDNHFIAMSRLLPGKTMADVRAYLDVIKSGGQPSGPPPVKDVEALGTGVVSPGRQMTLHYHLKHGRYAVFCWWPDADMGGLPHALMGMVRGVHVR